MRKPRLFITGSCGASLGQWEEQLGNAAILIGLSNLLSKYIPSAIVRTKYQLTPNFSQMYGIQSVHDQRVWGYRLRDLLLSSLNLGRCLMWRLLRRVLRVDVKILRSGGLLTEYSEADVVVDLSGDSFGDNANLRVFIKHCLDILAASALGKPIVSLANSPGPFTRILRRFCGKFVLNRMSVITLREPESFRILQDLSVRAPVIVTACPAFHLEPASDERVKDILKSEHVGDVEGPLVGVTLCGYNLYSDPTWGRPRSLDDLKLFIPTMKFLLDELKAKVLLIPHVYRTNPWTGEHIHGPDYLILRALAQLVDNRYYGRRLILMQGCYSVSEIKGVIGKLDLFISGRLHAGVAGLSQCVPTVLVAYGHKHIGFARLLNMQKYVHQGRDPRELLNIVREAWVQRAMIRRELQERVPVVKKLAEVNVIILRDLIDMASEKGVCVSEKCLQRWVKLGWSGQLSAVSETNSR